MGVLDKHPALFDLEYPVAGIAKLKNIPGQALKGKIFVEAADEHTRRLHDHVVIKLVGNGAAVHECR